MFLEKNDKDPLHRDQAKSAHEASPPPVHHCRKRNRKMIASSPYFHTPTNASVIRERKRHSSRHFQKSPSSTYGSIRSLGPFIHTWTGCTSAACRKKDVDVATCIAPYALSPSFDFCHTCHPIIRSAVAHFQECQWFQKRLRANALPLDTSLSCTLLMETKIRYAVRHLCPHQCFLKAYASSREWLYFRKEVHERTDQPIDELLQGWSCRLVPPHQVDPNEVGNGVFQEEQLQPEEVEKKVEKGDNTKWEAKPNGAIHPKIEFFYSKTNKSYRSSLEALRALGLDDFRKKRRTVDADNEMGNVDDKSNGGETYKCDTQASEDLLLSRIPPPYSDTPNTTIRPLFSIGRRRLWKESRRSTTVSASLPFLVLDSTHGRSPLGLLEELFVGDPWKLLVSTILLNRSRRAQVDYILWGFLERWPTPQALLASSNAATKGHGGAQHTNDHDDLRKWIQPLGLKTRRSQGLVQFCKDYLSLLEDKRCRMKAVPGLSSTKPLSETKNDRDSNDTDDSSDAAFRLTRDEILGLYNCGEYVADAYQIFIANHAINSGAKVDWKNIHPKDHALVAYVEWKRSIDTGKQD